MTSRAERAAPAHTIAGRVTLRAPRRHLMGWVAGGLLALIVLACLAAPLISAYDPTKIDAANAFAPPSLHHLAGTDELGRDLLTRVLYGGRFALLLSASATLIALVVGGIWGAAAAVRGGWPDEVLMRIADVTLAIPTFLLALMSLAAFGVSTASLIGTLGLLQAPWTARVLRAACASELRADYCTAAAAFGTGRLRLLVREVLPNTVPILLVQANVVLATSLILEATLSFVGLGVQPPQASWGTLVLEGYQNIYTSVTYILAPLLAICLTTSALNLLADELQSTARGR